jgi:hypothetical protein
MWVVGVIRDDLIARSSGVAVDIGHGPTDAVAEVTWRERRQILWTRSTLDSLQRHKPTIPDNSSDPTTLLNLFTAGYHSHLSKSYWVGIALVSFTRILVVQLTGILNYSCSDLMNSVDTSTMLSCRARMT